jgi:hypothetical protein
MPIPNCPVRAQRAITVYVITFLAYKFFVVRVSHVSKTYGDVRYKNGVAIVNTNTSQTVSNKTFDEA